MKVIKFEEKSRRLLKGYTFYDAEFKKWSSIPGVTICKCSDLKDRMIPANALVNFRIEQYPKQMTFLKIVSSN